MAALGTSAAQLRQDILSTGDVGTALKDLKRGLASYSPSDQEALLGMIFPGGRGRVMLTAINNLDRYYKKLGQVYVQQNQFGASVEATHRTMAFKLHAAWSAIHADMTEFGATLLPIIAKVLPKFIDAVRGVFQWLDHLNPAVKTFVTYLAGFLIVGGTAAVILGRMARAWVGIYSAIRGIGELGARVIGSFLGIKAPLGPGGGAGGAAATTALEGLTAAADAAAGALARVAATGDAASIPVGVPAGKPRIHPKPGAPLAKTASRGSRLLGGLKVLGHLAGWAGVGWTVYDVAHSFDTPLTARQRQEVKTPPWVSRFGPGAYGGLVTPTGIRRYAMGGLVDTVPAMLAPGEGVLTRAAMAGLGVGGLAALNSGAGLGNLTITPSPVYINMDGRMVARGVIQYVVGRAARGPSSLVGGSLATGAPLQLYRPT
jgi:hypothetical protein